MTLPFDCPADHILPLVGWFEQGVACREPGFLTDPRLSPDIKSSVTRSILMPRSARNMRTTLGLGPIES